MTLIRADQLLCLIFIQVRVLTKVILLVDFPRAPRYLCSMSLRGIVIGFLFLFAAQVLLIAQASPVSGVTLEGLKRTKVHYLERFLKTQAGDTVSMGRIEKDVQRLKNLAAIANAWAVIDTASDGSIGIHYRMTENWTLYPIINFGEITDNFWYQVGFSDANWLGNGGQLSAFYLNNDRRHNFNIFYRVPYFLGTRWGFSVTAFKWASVEPFYFPEGRVDYNYDHASVGGTVTYELAIDHWLESGVFYFLEKHQRLPDQESFDSPALLNEPKWLYKAIHRIRKLNFHYFYREGWENVFRYETVYNINYRDWFHLVFTDFHYYHRFGRTGNAAARLRMGLSTNSTSPFAPFLLDSQVNIRGTGNQVDRGTGVITLNLEYRQTVFENGLFAAQVVAFSDAGTWRTPGGDWADLLDRDNFRHFAGGGIRLIYKKAWNAILSADYGVDLYDFKQHGPVLYIGQYF